MTNSKTTKGALLASGISLLLCFAMLLGTTFAWFTDSVTSAGNVIQAGTLDVDLVDGAGNSMAGKVINFVVAGGNGDSSKILWEPGCTFETEPVFVKNKGNLALKYEIAINGISGDAKLLEAIEWTVTVGGVKTALADLKGTLLPGDDDVSKSAPIILSGHMKEEAGNEYQDLSASGISIAVVATQLEAEKDSFNNEYDKDSELPKTVTSEELAEELKEQIANNNGEISLEEDYVVTGDWVSVVAQGQDIVINGNGHTIKNLNQPLIAGSAGKSVVIKNLTIADSNIGPAANENGLGTGAFISYKDYAGYVTFENCHLINVTVESNYRAAGFIGYISNGEVIVKNCSVVNCEFTGVEGAAAIAGLTSANTTITNTKVESSKFTATEDREGTKAATAGSIIGTANGSAVITLNNVTSAGNTVSNNNSLAPYSEMFGRIVGSATVNIN